MRERSAARTVLITAILPCALGFASACGGDSKSQGNDAPDGSTASGGNGTGGGTTVSTNTSGSTGGPNDLSGTWDVIASEPDGDTHVSTVTLSPTQLRVDGELELLALVADDVVDIAVDGEAVRATRQGETDMDLGVIPLPLAGLLHFVGVPDEGPSCDYSLTAEALTLVCTDDVSAPNDLPELDSAELSAERTEALTSNFGELGGRWWVTAEDVVCSVVFQGNTIKVECAEGGSDSKHVNITVDRDRISGSTTDGLEFTAQRR